jgi:transposase-like protein
MTKRRKFSPEFKQEAVVLTCQPGVQCRQVALDIGILTQHTVARAA